MLQRWAGHSCDLSELRFRQSGEEVWPRRTRDSKPALTGFLQGADTERENDAYAADDRFVLGF